MTRGPPSGRLVARIINGETPVLDPKPYPADRFGFAGMKPKARAA